MLIILLLLCYGGIVLGVLGLAGWRRISRPIRENYTRRLLECLQPQESLPVTRFPDTEYLFHRRLLIGLLTGLASSLDGVEYRILRLVFHENGLDRHVLTECRYRDDIHKIRALAVFIDIPMPAELVDELGRFRESRNHELRMTALLAWLNHDSATLFERLAGHSLALSDRECAGIYALARLRGVPLAGAGALLDSCNPSVARFGRRVLKLNGV